MSIYDVFVPGNGSQTAVNALNAAAAGSVTSAVQGTMFIGVSAASVTAARDLVLQTPGLSPTTVENRSDSCLVALQSNVTSN